MAHRMRRIVTGHDGAGRSVIVSDGPPATAIEADGSGLFELWIADGVPAETAGAPDPTQREIRLEPPAGGIKLRYFLVPPERPDLSPEAQEAAAAFGFAAVHAAHARVDTAKHPMMHRTHTLDFIILVSGDVSLLLDEGETRLEPGDVVVQRATNHAWINHGREPALLIAVLIDGQD